MTKQNKIITVVVFTLLAIMLAASAFMMHGKPPKEGDMVACTMDALICPDGSGVGRSGPSCAFSACPSSGSLTGVYLSDEQGARLAVAAPLGIGSGTSYAVPLSTSSAPLDASLIGTMVTLEGHFTEGATFLATGVTESSDDNTLPAKPKTSTSVSIKIGETKFAGGMKITPNNITSDSRCPVDVECIWAGNITANVTLRSDTDKETVDLVSNATPHPFDSYQVSLTGATPDVRTNVRISRDGYTLTFLVESLGKTTPPATSIPPTTSVTPPKATGKCYVGGCSAQLCSDQPDMISNCMYSPQYACYKAATCERQPTGACGWTPTNELSMCLNQNTATTQAPVY